MDKDILKEFDFFTKEYIAVLDDVDYLFFQLNKCDNLPKEVKDAMARLEETITRFGS